MKDDTKRLADIYSNLGWLSQYGGRISFKERSGKCYATVSVSDGDGGRISVTASVDNDSGRVLKLVDIAILAYDKLSMVPF